jgi:hypothetical protein
MRERARERERESVCVCVGTHEIKQRTQRNSSGL